MEQMYSLQDVADLLQVSLHTVRRLLHKNAVPCFRVGRQIRVKPKDIHHFLTEMEPDDIDIQKSDFIPPKVKHQVIEDLGIKV